MAAHKANTTLHANTDMNTEPIRHLANFPPSIWGDRFVSFSLDNSELEAYAKAIEEPKEEMRRLIINPTIDSDAKLSLIYSVYRLGLTYLFADEIDVQLGKLFKELNLHDYNEADLYTISVNFQVFRQHGYKQSCDVFNKFKDCNTGTFQEYITADVKGMLSFYESTQLRIRGESVLDEASHFTEDQLKSVVNNLEGNLARKVKQALRRPYHKGMPIVEARLYFSNYEEECSSHELLWKLAKVHFNYLRLLHMEELHIVSKWWKDVEFRATMPYTRDRAPEAYLWSLGTYFEPRFSQARIIATKITLFIMVLDDTYDAYATIEENRILTDAINRWKTTAVEQLSEYIKPFYKILVNEYTEFEKETTKEGRTNSVNASKQAFQELARSYLEEAEWRHNGYVASFEEFMENGLTSSSYNLILKSALVGMGEIVTEEALVWYESHPKIIKASELIGRVQDDIVSFQFERERGQSVTSVEAYMKTFGVSEKAAIENLKKMVENAWKDINEGCLKPTEIPLDLLAPMLNLSRMVDVAYRYNDGFTFPENTFKEYITLLFLDSIPM